MRWQQLAAEREKWHQATLSAVIAARCKYERYERATAATRRRVIVTHYRVKLVDPDAVRGLAKPVVDRLQARYQTWVQRKPRKVVWLEGPALIWQDDEQHLDYHAEQVRVPHYRDELIRVRVEECA